MTCTGTTTTDRLHSKHSRVPYSHVIEVGAKIWANVKTYHDLKSGKWPYSGYRDGLFAFALEGNIIVPPTPLVTNHG